DDLRRAQVDLRAEDVRPDLHPDPGRAGTQTLGYYIYFTAQKYSDGSGAAAMSVLLIVPMAVMAWLYMRLVFRRD
ncbi:MAG: sugar ABC transporter permease, partial [Inquilinus sp.]|nr:sugar ABC transporter permease [Inquilinus sp.]